MSYAYDNDEFSHYYDRLVDEHLPRAELWIDTVNQIYKNIIERTIVNDPSATSSVIELGCGTGSNLIEFQTMLINQGNIRFIGIDHSHAMLARAKDKLDKLSTRSIIVQHGNLTDFADSFAYQSIDCILLPAGTFHHLIDDCQRDDFLRNVRRALRSDTGLCAVYLLPDSMIHVQLTSDHEHHDNRFRLISTDNQQEKNNEWLCQQTFTLDERKPIELTWQLRTCSASTLIQLFHRHRFQVKFCCLNGKDLLTYDEYCSLSSIDCSTPVILVVSNDGKYKLEID
jgi:SAM-dependent methyltransferase